MSDYGKDYLSNVDSAPLLPTQERIVGNIMREVGDILLPEALTYRGKALLSELVHQQLQGPYDFGDIAFFVEEFLPRSGIIKNPDGYSYISSKKETITPEHIQTAFETLKKMDEQTLQTNTNRIIAGFRAYQFIGDPNLNLNEEANQLETEDSITAPIRIVLEGISGVGKSEIEKTLEKKLQQGRFNYEIETRLPGEQRPKAGELIGAVPNLERDDLEKILGRDRNFTTLSEEDQQRVLDWSLGSISLAKSVTANLHSPSLTALVIDRYLKQFSFNGKPLNIVRDERNIEELFEPKFVNEASQSVFWKQVRTEHRIDIPSGFIAGGTLHAQEIFTSIGREFKNNPSLDAIFLTDSDLQLLIRIYRGNLTMPIVIPDNRDNSEGYQALVQLLTGRSLPAVWRGNAFQVNDGQVIKLPKSYRDPAGSIKKVNECNQDALIIISADHDAFCTLQDNYIMAQLLDNLGLTYELRFPRVEGDGVLMDAFAYVRTPDGFTKVIQDGLLANADSRQNNTPACIEIENYTGPKILFGGHR